MTFDLSSLGWDDDFEYAYQQFGRTDRIPARVTRVDRGVCTALGSEGTLRASVGGGLLAAAARDPLHLPCTGDWIVVRAWPDERLTVEAVLPRRTAVVRAGAGRATTPQVLAANVDTVAVVESVDPEPDLGRIERLLSLAYSSGARPLVVLTKVDCLADPRAITEEVAASAPGVPVLAVSAATGAGVRELRALADNGRTLGLIGASGVGKSTLVNALAGMPVMAVRGIRADGKGRHTTAYRALVPLPGGGAVLDTPGMRGVGLHDGDAGLERTFADIEHLAQTCRFDDCTHDGEPGCAVAAALDTGLLTGRRVASWRKLSGELAARTRRRSQARRRSPG
jgi:ribosome biogenesis GTPase